MRDSNPLTKTRGKPLNTLEATQKCDALILEDALLTVNEDGRLDDSSAALAEMAEAWPKMSADDGGVRRTGTQRGGWLSSWLSHPVSLLNRRGRAGLCRSMLTLPAS